MCIHLKKIRFVEDLGRRGQGPGSETSQGKVPGTN